MVAGRGILSRAVSVMGGIYQNEANQMVRKKRSPRVDTVKRPDDNDSLTYNSRRHKIGTLGDAAPMTYAVELSQKWLRMPLING